MKQKINKTFKTRFNRMMFIFLFVLGMITTKSNAQYCEAYADYSGCDNLTESISNVTFNTINNNSGCAAGNQYQDFTAISTDVIKGVTYGISVTTPYYFGTDDSYSVWIDFNHNNVFDTWEEFPLVSADTGTANITIPNDALLGMTTMRVRITYTLTNAMDPCGEHVFGEVEDYTVNVINAASPIITNFSPDHGCGGSAVVIITGSSFTGATSVTFGGTEAQSFTVDNDNQITATPASGSTGVITVTTPSASGSSMGSFTINAPGAWLGLSNDWFDPANWCGGVVPISSTNVIIPPGTPFPPVINGVGAVCNDIVISATTSLEVSSSYAITVNGNWTNDGTFIGNIGTVVFNGTTIISGTSINYFYHVNIYGTLTGPASSAIYVAGDWFNNGTWNHNNGTVNFNGTTVVSGMSINYFYHITIIGVFTAPSSGTIYVGGNWVNNGTWNHNSCSIYFNGNTVISGSSVNYFYHINIIGILVGPSSGSLYCGGDWINNGTWNHNSCSIYFNGITSISGSSSNYFFNISITGTLTGPSAGSIYCGGNWENNGTWNHNNCGIYFNGTTLMTGTSISSFFDIFITGTLTGPAGQNFFCGGNWTNNGTYNHNNGQISFNGTTIISGTSVNYFFDITIIGIFTGPSAGNIYIAGNWVNNGTFNHNNGTVNFNGTTYISGSSINYFFNITIYAILNGPSAGNFYIAGDWINSGTFTHNNCTINFNATTTGHIISGNLTGANAFYYIVFNGIGGGWSFSNSADFAGNFIITNGAVTAPAGQNINVSGDWNNNGTFIPNGGTVTFTGTTILTGSSSYIFFNITITGTLTCPASGTITVGGNWINNGTFIHNNGTVIFNGTTTLSGTSVFSFFNITISGILTAPSVNFYVYGDWVNNGTFNHNNGSISFSGTTTISGSSITSFFDIYIYGILTGHSNNIFIGGNWVNNGTWNHNNGKCSFNGTTLISGTTINYFYDIEITGILTGPSGINIYVAGNWINNGTWYHNNGTVIFNGTTLISGSSISSFYNITIVGILTGHPVNCYIANDWINNGTFNHNNGKCSFNGNTLITGTSITPFFDLTITGTLTGHPTNIYIAGNLINNGTWNHNNGRCTFNGITLISGSSITSFYDITITGFLTGHSSNMFIGHDWENNGTYFHNNGKCSFNGTTLITGSSITSFFDIYISGILTGHGNNMFIGGNWINDGTWNHNNGKCSFNGTTLISGSSVNYFYDITITGVFTGPSGINIYIAGNWINNGTWNHNNCICYFNGNTTISGSSISSFFDIFITGTLTGHSNEMHCAGNWTNNGTWNHNNGRCKFDGTTLIAGSSINYFYHITITGTLTAPSSSNIYLAGNWINSGTWNHNNCTIIFNGTVAQFITGVSIFYNFTINNSFGISLNDNIVINAVLTYTIGLITGGVHTMELGENASVVGAGVSKYTTGTIQLDVPNGCTCTKHAPIGDGLYGGIDIDFFGTTSSGYITITVGSTDANESYISGIDQTKKINRYWYLVGSQSSLGTYDVTFNFEAGNIIGGADPSLFIIKKFLPSVWASATVGTLTSTSSKATGLTTFGDYEIGIQASATPLAASSTGANILCHGGTTSVIVSATGGTTPYTGTGSFNVTAGTYTYTVTDNAFNTATTTITINQPATSVSASASSTNVSPCFGGNNGSASVSASGGTSGYSYLWNTTTTTSSISLLTAGSYSVTVTDVNGCTTTSTTTVTQPASLNLNVTGLTSVCFGTSTTLTASGATTYSWSPATGLNTSIAAIVSSHPTTLIPITYVVTGTSGGCTATRSVTVTPYSPTFTKASTNVVCTNNNNGTITLTPDPGNSPFTYKITNTVTNLVTTQATNLFTGLAPSQYKLQIFDVTGCPSQIIPVTTYVIITQPSALGITYTKTNVTCNGSGNGVITLSSSGGTGVKTFSDNNGASYQAGNIFTSIAVAVYPCIAKDANGCLSTVANVSITQPNAITFTTAVVNSSTCSNNSGSIIIYASGGTGTYNFSKNGGATWQSGYTFTGLAPGTYSMKVKDANGCMSNAINVVVGCNAREAAASTLGKTSFDVYPNPTNDHVTITFSNTKEEAVTISLRDITGRIILSSSTTSIIGNNQYMMNTSGVSKGIYMLILQSGDGVLQSRIVIQ